VDLLAVADAIADRFTGVTATFDGKTEGLELATARLPNQIGKGPVLLVYPPSGILQLEPMRQRNDIWDFTILVLRDPTNVPDRTGWLYAWLNATRDRVEMQYRLGLTYVAQARMEGEARLEIDGEEYSQVGGLFAPFDVVEQTCRVWIQEVVTTVAI
jgi:hypothetical protein